MIKYTELAALIEAELNGQRGSDGEFSNLKEYLLSGGVFGNGDRYEFKVIAGDMEYTRAERQGAIPTNQPTNDSTYYISAVLRPLQGDSVEGTSEETLNAVINAEIDFLIPNCDREGSFEIDGEIQTIRLQDAVLSIINDKLSLPNSQYYDGEDGNIYYLSASFGHISIGEKQIRGLAGLSLTASMSAAFSVVATGISSRDITLSYNGEQVYTTRIGLARTSTQDGTVPSDSNGITKNATSATSLTISLDAPLRRSAFFGRYISYVINGLNYPFDVTIGYPLASGGTGSKTYTVCFANTGINGELNLAASVNIQLVEALDI